MNKQIFETCLKAKRPIDVNKAIQNLIKYTDSERKYKTDNINSFAKEILEEALPNIFSIVDD
jgi:hypothetical protein